MGESVKIEQTGGGPDRTWKVSLQMGMTVDQLEAVAEGIEAGEIEPGSCTIDIDAAFYDQLDPELVKRLAGVIRRQ